MVNWINIIGLFGLFFGAFGPLLIVLANTTEIWRWRTDTDQLDQLKDARNQVRSSGLSSDDPAFKTLYQWISADVSPDHLSSDLPPIDAIDRISSGIAYGSSTDYVYYEKEDSSQEEIIRPNDFERLVNEQIQYLRDKGRQEFFIGGMILLSIGFICQFIAYSMNNPPI